MKLVVSVFQFHKGTIKTLLLVGGCCGCQEFQFHKGTIKTEARRLIY